MKRQTRPTLERDRPRRLAGRLAPGKSRVLLYFATAFTVSTTSLWFARPVLSIHVMRTVYLPALVNLWLTLKAFRFGVLFSNFEPSPQLIASATVAPLSGSTNWPLNVAFWPALIDV